MERRAILTFAQSTAVVAGCAAIAYSLSLAPSMGAANGVILAAIGAAIGLVGVALGAMARPSVAAVERRYTPLQLLGLRISVVALFVVGAGWLIGIFVSDHVGFWLMTAGIVSGIFGIVLSKVVIVASRR